MRILNPGVPHRRRPITLLFVAAQNDADVLTVFGAPVRVVYQATIFRGAVTIGGATRIVIPPGRLTSTELVNT